MSSTKNPPIDVPPLDPETGLFVPDWYDRFQYLNGLDPLSSIVFPTVPPSVTSIDSATGDFTLGYGLSRSTLDLRVGLTSIAASLGADVLLNNTANFFDGPSVAQGTTGTWFASGTVTITDTTSAANCLLKLWDGTTVIASCEVSVVAGGFESVSLSGILASPAGNIRISARDLASTNGKIIFNNSGTSKDSTITAVRIA